MSETDDGADQTHRATGFRAAAQKPRSDDQADPLSGKRAGFVVAGVIAGGVAVLVAFVAAVLTFAR